jgi:phosphoribosylanthranilate isomerase
VEPSVAAQIVAALPGRAQAVGVFVDRPPAEVVKIAEQVGFRVVQLHGQEPPEDLLALGNLRIVRAFRIDRRAGFGPLGDYLRRARALGRLPDAVLIDAFVSGQPGGTGVAIGEELLRDVPPLHHLILSGGLTPETVADRVARFRPWMVDVASGVESAPGRKDLEKVAAFIRAAQSVDIPVHDPVDKPAGGL